jgi:hypothetical protein
LNAKVILGSIFPQMWASTGMEGRGVTTTKLYLLPRLRMSGAIPLFHVFMALGLKKYRDDYFLNSVCNKIETSNITPDPTIMIVILRNTTRLSCFTVEHCLKLSL